MSGFSWTSEEQDSVTDKHEYETTTKASTTFESPATSGRPGMMAMEPNDDVVLEVEISAGQKMLSAVSGSLLTSLLCKQHRFFHVPMLS